MLGWGRKVKNAFHRNTSAKALTVVRKLSVVAVLALGVGAIGISAASAATCGSALLGERVFTLTTTPDDATCLASGAGNLEGNGSDEVNLLGYLTLDKSDDTVSGALPGSLTFTPPQSGLSGTFSISAPGYSDLVVGLKVGGGQLVPVWAAFLLPSGIFDGSWSISGNQELSHAVLYGKLAAVPLPATLPLLAGGLGLLGVFGWRRKRSAPASA